MTEYLLLIVLIVSTFGFSRIRQTFFAEVPATYNKLMLGQLFWLVALFIHVCVRAGWVAEIAYLITPAAVITAEALCLAAGAIVFGSGLYDWLTAIADTRQSAALVQSQLALMHELSAALHISVAPAERAAQIAATLTKFLDCRPALWLKLSPGGVVSAPAAASLDTELLSRRLMPYRQLLDSANFVFVSDGLRDNACPAVVMPTGREGDDLTLALLEWDSSEFPGDRQMALLQSANGLFAMQPATGAGAPDRTLNACLAELRRELGDAELLEDKLLLIYDTLRRALSFELLRIAVFDPRGFQVTQYCVGKGRNLISERNKSIATHSTQLGRVFASPQLIAADDLARSNFEDDRWLSSCGVNYALTFPVLHNNLVIAAITLASESPTLPYQLGEQIAADLITTLAPAIRVDQLNHQLVALNRQLLDLTGALRIVAQEKTPDRLLAELMSLLVHKLPATFCRLWRYDRRADTIELVGESASHDVSAQAATVTTVPLNTARWHNAAVQHGRLIVINQREEHISMDDGEISLTTVAGVQSALIIPIVANCRVLGLLTISELRCWERSHFSLADTLFARGMAGVMAHVLERIGDTLQVDALRRRVNQLERTQTLGEVFVDLPVRLATPLTSIMARTDHLITTVGVRDEDASTNLVAIKRQAEKIVKEVRAIQEARRGDLVGV